MEAFLQLTFSGLANGTVYALLAVGFVVIYKASDVINFAQGEFLLLGAYVGVTSIGVLELPWAIGILLCVLVAAFVGAFVEWTVVRPLIGEPVIAVIMASIALASLLRAAVQLVWGVRPRAFPSFLPEGEIEIGGAVLSLDRLSILVVGAILLAAVAAFFRVSREGLAMRAVADDPQAAMSMGVRLSRTLSVAWSLAAGCAAIGGVLLASLVGVSQDITFIGLRVFPVVILGGLDSLAGAALGGVIVGLLEAYAAGYVGLGVQRVAPFVVLILILMVRPYGLFGRERIERV
jgi:branched-chain amino acid transport system permease protein